MFGFKSLQAIYGKYKVNKGKLCNFDVTITESGLVAAMHLVGIRSLITALEIGDLMSEHDDNGTTAREYMDTFGGYNLDEVK